jgi:hypothetical protein
MRSVAILAAGAAAFLLAYAAMYDGLRLAFKLDPDEAAVTVGLVVNLLVTPAVYIAAILLYLDLRSRKEGYGFAELAEDIC